MIVHSGEFFDKKPTDDDVNKHTVDWNNHVDKKPTNLRLVRGGIVYYPQEEVYKLQNESHQKGCNSTLDEVEKIIDDWYDTSIKDKNSKVALMITNGGYMNKIDFKEKIKEMRK